MVSDDVVSAAMIGARKDLFFFSSFLLFVQQCNLAFAITNLAGWLAPTARLLRFFLFLHSIDWTRNRRWSLVVVAVAGNEQGSVLCLCLCVCASQFCQRIRDSNNGPPTKRSDPAKVDPIRPVMARFHLI